MINLWYYELLHIFIYIHNVCSPVSAQTIGFEQTSYTFSESDVFGAVTVVASQVNVSTFASIVGGMLDVL